eukprot:210107-Hanusia_phi.AAC.1
MQGGEWTSFSVDEQNSRVADIKIENNCTLSSYLNGTLYRRTAPYSCLNTTLVVGAFDYVEAEFVVTMNGTNGSLRNFFNVTVLKFVQVPETLTYITDEVLTDQDVSVANFSKFYELPYLEKQQIVTFSLYDALPSPYSELMVPSIDLQGNLFFHLTAGQNGSEVFTFLASIDDPDIYGICILKADGARVCVPRLLSDVVNIALIIDVKGYNNPPYFEWNETNPYICCSDLIAQYESSVCKLVQPEGFQQFVSIFTHENCIDCPGSASCQFGTSLRNIVSPDTILASQQNFPNERSQKLSFRISPLGICGIGSLFIADSVQIDSQTGDLSFCMDEYNHGIEQFEVKLLDDAGGESKNRSLLKLYVLPVNQAPNFRLEQICFEEQCKIENASNALIHESGVTVWKVYQNPNSHRLYEAFASSLTRGGIRADGSDSESNQNI